MGDAIVERDWSASPLGEPQTWPTTLKTTVSLALASHFPKCIVWGSDMISLPNSAFVPIFGKKPHALGRPFKEVWAEVWDELEPMVARALAGEATFVEDFPLSIERGDGPEDAYFTFCYSPIRDEWGKVVGFLDTVFETTGKVRAERQLRVANEELGHRIKNALTVFQAIASQSFAGDLPREEVRKRLQERLSALGAAHDLLLKGEGDEARVGEVVARAMRPLLQHPESVSIGGPLLALSGRQALSLALAVHELATNSVKYGALTVPTGRVDASWEQGPDGFRFVWRESGGPIVSVPERRGFGSRLVERVLAADFRGTATIDFAPEGVCFTLSAPALAISAD